jgi:hypothetical protein
VAPSALAVQPQTPTRNLAFQQALANDGAEPVVLKGLTVIVDAAGVLRGHVPFQAHRLLPGESASLRAGYAGGCRRAPTARCRRSSSRDARPPARPRSSSDETPCGRAGGAGDGAARPHTASPVRAGRSRRVFAYRTAEARGGLRGTVGSLTVARGRATDPFHLRGELGYGGRWGGAAELSLARGRSALRVQPRHRRSPSRPWPWGSPRVRSPSPPGPPCRRATTRRRRRGLALARGTPVGLDLVMPARAVVRLPSLRASPTRGARLADPRPGRPACGPAPNAL